MTRDRANPAETFTADTEQAMARSFDLPSGRSFAIGGSAMVSARAPDQEVDRWLGRPDPAITDSSSRLAGDLAARSSSALDGDPTTAWSPALGPQVGNWISVTLPHPITLDHWTMQVVADGRHSVPTRLRIQVDNRPDVIVDVPPVADQSKQNATVSVPVSIPASVGPLTATSSIVVTVDAVRAEQSVDELTKQPTTLPVGIAELGFPGITVPTAGSSVPAGCRTDLLTVDGQPVGIRILGTAAAAASGHGLALQACGPGVDPTGALHLGPGRHVVRTAPGLTTGIDINRLVLASDKGGGARSATTPPFRAGGSAGAAGPAAAPAVTVVSTERHLGPPADRPLRLAHAVLAGARREQQPGLVGAAHRPGRPVARGARSSSTATPTAGWSHRPPAGRSTSRCRGSRSAPSTWPCGRRRSACWCAWAW